MAAFKRYTKEDKRKFAKQKQKESKETLNSIYAIATDYTTSPEYIAEYLEYSNRVYQYSPRNQILIAKQLPNALFVQSITRWEEMGYHIRPEFVGKGAVIIRPITRTMYMDENGNWKPLKGSGKETYNKYKRGELTTKDEFHYWQTTVSAYDITMTDCPAEDYPQIFSWGEKRLRDSIMVDVLTQFADQELGCPVTIDPLIGTRGVYYPSQNKISLSDLTQDTQRASTLAHEIGHTIQYKTATDIALKSAALKEVEADCYSIMICNRLGLEIPEGRKRHLANHYQKYIQEMMDKGQYDPDTDSDGSNNPFFRVMNDVKRVYESYTEALDNITREYQGNYLYYQNIQELANSVRLSIGTAHTPDPTLDLLENWEKQFFNKVDEWMDSAQFQNWHNNSKKFSHLSIEDLVSRMKMEIEDTLSRDITPAFTSPVVFVLQLKDIPANRDYEFASLSTNSMLSIEQYDFIYTHDLNITNYDFSREENRLQCAEQTFVDLNSEYMPGDFIGHSLSVSDVVILYSPQENIFYPYYCDRYGFKELSQDFITQDVHDRLLAGFTIVEETKTFHDLKDNGFNVESLEGRGNYLLMTYEPRLLAKENMISLNTLELLPSYITESRFQLGNTQYSVMMSRDYEVYLGNPARIEKKSFVYNNSDGSLIHLGNGIPTFDLYRYQYEIHESLLEYINLPNEGNERANAIQNYASPELTDTLSSFTEIKPLVFDGIPFKDAYNEIFTNAEGGTVFVYYTTDNKKEIQKNIPLTDEEMKDLNVYQLEEQEPVVQRFYIESISRLLDEIQYSIDPNGYRETIGDQFYSHLYNQKRIIADIETGKMTYQSLQQDILHDMGTYSEEVSNLAREALHLLEIANQKYGERSVPSIDNYSLIQNVAIMENKLNIPTEQRMTKWFGDYALYELKSEFTETDLQNRYNEFEKNYIALLSMQEAAKARLVAKGRSIDTVNIDPLYVQVAEILKEYQDTGIGIKDVVANRTEEIGNKLGIQDILYTKNLICSVAARCREDYEAYMNFTTPKEEELEYVVTDSNSNSSVFSDPNIALEHFIAMEYPKTFNIQICSDNVDMPHEPILAGSNNVIDLNIFLSLLKQNIGTEKDIAAINQQLGTLSEIIQEKYPDILSINDKRHERRDFRFAEKLEELIADNQIPFDMQEIITDHESLIMRRLSTMDKHNLYLTKGLTNEEVFQDDSLFLSAIEKTLNADKSLDPIGCIRRIGMRLEYTPWYQYHLQSKPELDLSATNNKISYYVNQLENENEYVHDDIPNVKDAFNIFAQEQEKSATPEKLELGISLEDHNSTYRQSLISGDGILNLQALVMKDVMRESPAIQFEMEKIQFLVQEGDIKCKEFMDVPNLPYVHIIFSENPAFAENEILSLKDAEKKFAELDQKVSSDLGYDKTIFALYLSNGSFIQDQYDIGDGYGGLVEFIDQSFKEGADFNLEYGHMSRQDYDQTIKEKNALVKDLWNDIDMQAAEQEQKNAEIYTEKFTMLSPDQIEKEKEGYISKIKESQQIVSERLSRIEGRNKWFKEYGYAGELDYGNIPPIKKGNPIKPLKLLDPIEAKEQKPKEGDIVLDNSGAICRVWKINQDADMICTAPLENAEDYARKLSVDFKDPVNGYGWYPSKDISLLKPNMEQPKEKNPIKASAINQHSHSTPTPDPEIDQ